MLNTEFYDILDAELTQLVEDNGFHPLFKKKDAKQKKAAAFLMWFLKLYGRTQFYSRYITEGAGDNSCDIIFDVDDAKGNKTYYVVQSKWNVKGNIKTKVSSTNVKSALDDFQVMLLGEKEETKNENFNKKYKELKKHVAENGIVKFVYFALCNDNPKAYDNIKSFEKNYKTTLRFLDINRIKRDYIDYQYRRVISDNPLESNYSPTEEIEIEIEQFNIAKNFVEIEKPFVSHIFLVRPKVIFNLFETYKNKLFFKNVRNPLIHSQVNDNIETTLNNEIPFFWYYNNGITAVTEGIVNDKINNTARKIKVSGLQVINGAQTVHSVYKSYSEASRAKRRIMDKEAFLTLRLLTVNSDNMITKITRFTNSQNPMEHRDFRANDEVQFRLQEASFDTSYWYEKRRGEFIEDVPKDVTVVSNEDFAIYHYLFNLDKSQSLDISAIDELRKFIFVTKEEDKRGLYEDIFNDSTSFDNMLAAYLFIGWTIDKSRPSINREIDDSLSVEQIQKTIDALICWVPFARIILDKYLKYKKETKETHKYILEGKDENVEIFARILLYTVVLAIDSPNNSHEPNRVTRVFKTFSQLDNLRAKLESLYMTDEIIQEIEQFDLENPPQI